MRTRLFFAVLLLAAMPLFARPVETALTNEGCLYAIRSDGEAAHLELTFRTNDVSETLVVPSTEDAALESDPRIAYDAAAHTLYVAWHRNDPEGDEVRLATRAADGTWSAPVTISGCNSAHRSGLELELTHVDATTLVHLAWWKVGELLVPQYALVAFEEESVVSTDVENLEELAGLTIANDEIEDTGTAAHPPLAMARAGESVDVVFGVPYSTALQRVRLKPGKIASDARIWKPGRSGDGASVPRSGLVSLTTAPVQAFLANGRIVLFTPDAQFRFMVYEDGAWTPTRMIRADDATTRDDLLRQIRKTMEEGPADDGSAAQQ